MRIVESAASRRSPVLGVGTALLGEQEAGAGDRALGARLQRPGDVGALGDPAGEQQGIARRQRRAHPLEQLERRVGPAHVPARLDALDDHRVGAGGRVAARASATEPHWWSQVPPVRRFGAAPEGDDDVGGRRRPRTSRGGRRAAAG